MKIKYTISSGTAPYVATLSGATVYVNNHVAAGTYEFTGVANDTYVFTVTDLNLCEIVNSDIVVDNALFTIEAISTGTDIDTVVNISGDIISTKENSYILQMNPLVAETATGTYDINYLVDGTSSLGNTAIASINVFKNNVLINSDSQTNTSSSGTFNISVVTTDVIRVRLYGNTTLVGGGGTATVTDNMSVNNVKVNNNVVAFDTSLATKSLTIT